ncbi:hypothetical protein KY334_02020 [Candidatus Woesearchaeota archaeon]|nr:hypothetical protein [Candidatus Woesearchaeota archaeon]
MFIPYATWISWSVLHTYFIANIKGFFNIKTNWFETPKTNRTLTSKKRKSHHHIRLINLITLIGLFYVYYIEWVEFGWLDVYAFFWIPALAVGIFSS